VEKNRDLYKAKFDVAEKVFADWPGFTRPAAGFFLWLPVPMAGGGEAAALKLWRDCGIRVLPGAYLTQPSADGTNIGAGYIRIALVGDLAETEKSLPQIVACLALDLTADAARHVEVVT
jgi:aspartate/methionine/tyrosine aminotransferase